MIGRSQAQQALARRGNEIIRHSDDALASASDFDKPNVVLFIHGFTADASYLRRLMDQFAGAGFHPLAFNYACFDGIDVAAESLAGLLSDLDEIGDGAVTRNRVILVCHSMGGLVGRAFITLEGGDKYARKLITLGTPHDGTLTDPKLIEYMLAWGESVSGLMQGGFSVKARSAQQLIGRDAGKLLNRLRSCGAPTHAVQFHSISGGLDFIELGKNGWLNLVANRWIQGQMAGLTNDGLVADSSSDLSQIPFKACAPGCTHTAKYPEWSKTNHSALLTNYRVGLIAIRKAKVPGPESALLTDDLQDAAQASSSSVPGVLPLAPPQADPQEGVQRTYED